MNRSGSERLPALEKVVPRHRLEAHIGVLRQSSVTVVFTNGCFDILHIGHARYLAEARALGDYLIVGLNSDASVRALKGPDRPMVPQEERAELLAHLESVSCVTLFDEQRPDSLIEIVRPDIHVKGGDYTAEALPEAEVVRRHGGRVEIVSLIDGKSTTDIIQRVRSLYGR